MAITTQQTQSRIGTKKMNDIILQRITDTELAEFCETFHLKLEQITPHQLRVEGIVDFYPKRNRYHILKENRWGTARSIEDFRVVLIGAIPELNVVDDPIPIFKQWYESLVKLPYDERTQGQLTMLSNVLQYLLPAEDYAQLTTVKEQ